jgi:hypothetical protein
MSDACQRALGTGVNQVRWLLHTVASGCIQFRFQVIG